MDQLYSRTETPDGSDAGQLPEEASGDGSESAGIMSSLPRRRPHRRSARRAVASPRHPVAASAGAAQAVAVAAPAETRPHLRAVADAAPMARAPRQRRSKRRTLPEPREPAPGIGRLALDGMFATAKLPWRVAAEVARQAAGSLPGTLRR